MRVILNYRARNYHRAFNQNNQFPKTYHVCFCEQIIFCSSPQSTCYNSNGKINAVVRKLSVILVTSAQASEIFSDPDVNATFQPYNLTTPNLGINEHPVTS